MTIARYRGTLTKLGAGAEDIIAATAVALGSQLAIKELRFSLDPTGGGGVGTFGLQQAAADINGFYSAAPAFIERTYRTPVVIDGLALATTFGFRVTGGLAGDIAHGFISGDLGGRPNNTVRNYGTRANAGIFGVDYTVPAGRVLHITDIDFSAQAASIYRLSVGGVVVFDATLMAAGLIMTSVVTPIAATAGQVVSMAHTAATTAHGFWNGYLV